MEFRDLAVVRGGRAAPLRRAPARGARREGARRARAARAPHDRHADPAHALADRVRRPRRDRAARAARRAPAGGDARRGRRPRPCRARTSGSARRSPPGRQCFVVCPLVEESEALQAKAATAEFERLRATEFRDQRVELIHGQMPSKAKRRRWRRSPRGEADVLVATSVIEVGIDVPNATVMLIEAAERYGLSQLHQLRGRVGRGEHGSLCILFGDPSLPRLEAIADERDGFRLAEIDLELRGAGEVLGTRQHGLPRVHGRPAPRGRRAARASARPRRRSCCEPTPTSTQPEHALLRDAAVGRFGPSSIRSRREGRGRRPTGAGACARRAAAARGRPPTACARRSSRCSATCRGARVLDLYAGSGALGIEALSRGAASRRCSWSATAPRWPRSARNLERPGAPGRRHAAGCAALPRARPEGPFDLVFCDPPYDSAARHGRTARRERCRRCSTRTLAS